MAERAEKRITDEDIKSSLVAAYFPKHFDRVKAAETLNERERLQEVPPKKWQWHTGSDG